MANTIINQEIEINIKHITEFPLDSETGTKAMKEKFHKDAIKSRNEYVNLQLQKFQNYQLEIYKMLQSRVNSLIPSDNNEQYENDKKILSQLESCIKFNSDNLGNDNKLGFCNLISKLNDDVEISLGELNLILGEFIDKFLSMNINLTSTDFQYSMFTEKYMKSFLENRSSDNFNSVMQKVFDSIYWECPSLIKHLKLNLWYLLEKYKKEIAVFTNKIANDYLSSFNLTKDMLLKSYKEKRENIDNNIGSDEFLNLNNFLEKKKNVLDYIESSPTRSKNFNQFILNNEFANFTNEEQEKYYSVIFELSGTLDVLKNYYRYEFIVKDLQEKYAKRVENKALYDNKLKEIKTEENKRIKIYKSYLKANGIGFLAKVNNDKISSSKLQMNEQILKLYDLYKELHDLEIVYNLNNVRDVASLYDLLLVSYSSYYYMENKFKEHFSDNGEYNFSLELENYFKFIYNPFNTFMLKINAFNNYDITDVIADKFRLLNLNISKEQIDSDNIDLVIDTINYIKLIRYISLGKLSLEDMAFIVKFKEYDDITNSENN